MGGDQPAKLAARRKAVENNKPLEEQRLTQRNLKDLEMMVRAGLLPGDTRAFSPVVTGELSRRRQKLIICLLLVVDELMPAIPQIGGSVAAVTGRVKRFLVERLPDKPSAEIDTQRRKPSICWRRRVITSWKSGGDACVQQV